MSQAKTARQRDSLSQPDYRNSGSVVAKKRLLPLRVHIYMHAQLSSVVAVEGG
jgi:hypothetical protein